MDRKGQRVKFQSYEKPKSRVLEGTVISSRLEDRHGWYHSIEADENFITIHTGEKDNKILRTENELI